MFKNYLLTSIRNFKKNTFYLLANVLGLAVSIAICVIGFFNYQFNTTFNDYFSNAENLYKVHGERIGKKTVGSSPVALAPLMEGAGYEAMRYHNSRQTFKVLKERPISKSTEATIRLSEADLFSESVAFVDPAFTSHFRFDDLQGMPLSLEAPDAIAITQETAIKWFGRTDVQGEVVALLDDEIGPIALYITQVLDEFPRNISFRFDVMMHMDQHLKLATIDRQSWDHRVHATFLMLDDHEKTTALAMLDQTLQNQDEGREGVTVDTYRLDDLPRRS